MSLKFNHIRAAALAGASLLWLGAALAATAQTEQSKSADTKEADAKNAMSEEKSTGTAAVIVNTQGEVERVLVTGRLEEMLPQQLSQFGTRVDIVTAAQIQDGGYLDITQSLQNLVPGLYIVNQNGPFDYVDVSFQDR
jgi:hypothetical protein